MRIEARELTTGYGRRPAIQAIDLCLDAGEMVGLIGPNGAGKSTLLRALSGVLPLMQGSVTLGGRAIATFPARERARSIAFVPQTEAALFDFTVREIVLMGRYAHGSRSNSKDDFEEATRAMSESDVLHLADRPITALSGGEHRRVLLARALAQRAPLMLLDEPTAHLDVTHQAEVLSLLHRQSRSQGVGVLAALHDLNLASDYCDRLVLISSGRVQATGTPDEVMTADLLSRAFGGDLQVARNPASGRPFLIAARTEDGSAQDKMRIHVICGGGSGLEILSALHRRGYRLSAGVLNCLDADEQASAVLGIPTALEKPFSAIGEEALSACRDLIASADMLVVAPVPLGKGNVANLELAAEALTAGKRVALLGGDPVGRDFTGGAAADLWNQLKERGALSLSDLAALEAELSRMSAASEVGIG